MAALLNIGPGVEKKRSAVLCSNYKADMYEGSYGYTPFTRYNRLPKRLNNRFDNRLNRVNGLLERDVVKRICFSFWICSLVFKLHEFKVAPSPNCGAKFADFCPSNVRIQIGPPSDLRYKTIPHSDILTKVPLGGVLRPRRLEREK